MISQIEISFIIVNYFLANEIGKAIISIEKYCNTTHEIIVIDNSNDAEEYETLKIIAADTAVIINPMKNMGFGAACNLGAAKATGRYIFLLNPDAAFIGPVCSEFVSALEENKDIGVIGGRLVDHEGKEQHSYSDFPTLRLPLKRAKGCVSQLVTKILRKKIESGPKYKVPISGRVVDSVYGADMMISKSDFSGLHGFDEKYFMYGEEVDLQYRLFRDTGKRALVIPLDVYHADGGTNVPGVQRWKWIESGYFRFMINHRSPLVAITYWQLTILLKILEVAASVITLDFSRTKFHTKVLVYLIVLPIKVKN